jgi:hypothetical protein
MLCKIWGFHGGDYYECRLVGYKNPVRTSQETHYVSATELSRLIICKIWGFHGSDYDGSRLLGYKYPVRTSQETHFISATESSRLTLCKIWRFHGSDYDGSRLLGYKYPVRTSQETHYISATEYSRLMLCKIWGLQIVTMKNSVFWDVNTQFVPHRTHITSLLQSSAQIFGRDRFKSFPGSKLSRWQV